MSYCLEERLSRGWRNFYFGISFITLILGGAFYFFNIFHDSLSPFIAPSSSSLALKSVTMISAGYQIIISSIAYPVILSLKEMAIVPIDRSKRFTSKLLIDLVFVKGFLILGSLWLNFLIAYNISIKTSLPFIAGVFFTISASRLAFIYYLGDKIHLELNKNAYI